MTSTPPTLHSLSPYLEQDDKRQPRGQDTPVLLGELVRVRRPGGFSVVFVPRAEHTGVYFGSRDASHEPKQPVCTGRS